MSDSLISLVSKSHMFDQLYDHMLEQITSGAVKPGERIKDSEWATKFGVSRTPMREAIRKLTQEGLLVSLPTGGYEIRRLSQKELVQLYGCRAALEGAAVREVTIAADPKVISEVGAVLRDTQAAIDAKDLKRAFDLNTRYHKVIMDACDNAFIKDMLSSLQRMIRVYRGNALNDAQKDEQSAEIYLDRLRVKQQHHAEIYDAIAAGDHVKASNLMVGHVNKTVDDLVDSKEGQAAERESA
ncbi:MAG: hypothetical protein DI587_11190 [Variovorax paradoxus]|nr:MAG: hypothetical protein DI583_11190 [Variovorax paradoxus]PZQ11013.1 MAG: hypothetical protein DI587_11190 [Variovorax paradoxus]